MALANNYIKFVLSGAVSSVDTWSIGFHADPLANGQTQSDLDTFTSGGLAAFQADFWNGSTIAYKSLCNSSTTLVTAKSYLYSSAGSTVLESVATQSPSAGTGTNIHPPYVACVATLNTLSFGRSYRGRVYLPYTGGGMNAGTGNMTGIVQAIADEMATFLGHMNTGFGSAIAAKPSVFSRTLQALTYINQVKINTVPDTQRGRQSNAVATSAFIHAV